MSVVKPGTEICREDSVLEITNNNQEESKQTTGDSLYNLADEIFKSESTLYDDIDGDIPIRVRSDWFSNLSTNVRYQISEVPIVPIFGYEKVDFSIDAPPVVMLSSHYQVNESNQEEIVGLFLEEFRKIIWVTYRYGFKPLERVEGENVVAYSSDTGWGCTIRVGQMMLMRTLQTHFYTENADCYLLLQLIQENLIEAPFSIHQIAIVGLELGKKPGDWYSPSTMCHAIDKLLEMHPMPRLKSKIFMETIIYKDQLYSTAAGVDINKLLSNCGCQSENKDNRCQKCITGLNDLE